MSDKGLEGLEDLEDKKATVEQVLSRWNEVLHAVTDMVTRDQMIVRILVVSFVIDILLTFFIGFGAVHLHDLSNQYQILACHSGNAFRSRDLHIWEQLLKILTPKHPNVGWDKFLTSFQKVLHTALAPKSCKL